MCALRPTFNWARKHTNGHSSPRPVLFFPNVLVCVELRDARFIFRVAAVCLCVLTFSWCAAPPLSTWLRSWCPVCVARRRSACSQCPHSLALSLSLEFFSVTQHTTASASSRDNERCSAGRLPTDTAGRWALHSLGCFFAARVFAPPRKRRRRLRLAAVPYDSKRKTRGWRTTRNAEMMKVELSFKSFWI